MGSSCSMHGDVNVMLVRKCKKERQFQQPSRFGSEIRCWMLVHGSSAQGTEHWALLRFTAKSVKES